MIARSISVIALSLPLLLAGCDDVPVSSNTAATEVSRLTALGYTVTGRSASGNTTVLRYSGPINASVQCAQGSGRPGTLRPRVVAANGAVQDYILNSYLVVRSGTTARRDGLYVISKTTRPSRRAAATRIESIAFEPGDRGTFQSGLSCRGA